MPDANTMTGDVTCAAIEVSGTMTVTPPEGLGPFGRSESRDRAKNKHTLWYSVSLW
jgi:hypothetical protein